MRMSRRAALNAVGSIWDKYKYSYKSQRNAKSYTFSDWSLTDSGSSGGWANGYDGYKVNIVDDYGLQSYVIVGSGYYEYINSSNPGTVYFCSGLMMYKTTVNSDGSWTKHYRTLNPVYTDLPSVWIVQDHIGKVRTKEGSLPDAGRGYTYVKTDGEYTIMTDGENHYAYMLRG